jgi:NIPSNAP protein
MALTTQLRIYTVNRGQMEPFVTAWREKIVPLRQKYGFKIDGGWIYADVNKFIWMVSYDGPLDWEAANAAYYDAPERKLIQPEPSDYIAHMELHLINSVPER